ncbi:MAG: tetratricopeptide repeat protein [Neomegalonema sp.]|nr:tetratricopeptide repeat protein [Neomegalonema sp.]
MHRLNIRLCLARLMVVLALFSGPAALLWAPPATAQSVDVKALSAEARSAVQTGDWPRGEAAIRQLYEYMLSSKGERDRGTLTLMGNLAYFVKQQGRYAEAEQLNTRVLTLRRETLGEAHLDTLASMNNLARIYQDQGRYAEAEPLFREAWQHARQTLGDRHPNSLTLGQNLAELLDLMDRAAEAAQVRQSLQ